LATGHPCLKRAAVPAASWNIVLSKLTLHSAAKTAKIIDPSTAFRESNSLSVENL
jgi:hypothetical protein